MSQLRRVLIATLVVFAILLVIVLKTNKSQLLLEGETGQTAEDQPDRVATTAPDLRR